MGVLVLCSNGYFLTESIKQSSLGESGLSLLDPLQRLIPAAMVPGLKQHKENWAIGLEGKETELAPVVPFVFDDPLGSREIDLCYIGMCTRKKLVKLM